MRGRPTRCHALRCLLGRGFRMLRRPDRVGHGRGKHPGPPPGRARRCFDPGAADSARRGGTPPPKKGEEGVLRTPADLNNGRPNGRFDPPACGLLLRPKALYCPSLQAGGALCAPLRSTVARGVRSAEVRRASPCKPEGSRGRTPRVSGEVWVTHLLAGTTPSSSDLGPPLRWALQQGKAAVARLVRVDENAALRQPRFHLGMG